MYEAIFMCNIHLYSSMYVRMYARVYTCEVCYVCSQRSLGLLCRRCSSQPQWHTVFAAQGPHNPKVLLIHIFTYIEVRAQYTFILGTLCINDMYLCMQCQTMQIRHTHHLVPTHTSHKLYAQRIYVSSQESCT